MTLVVAMRTVEGLFLAADSMVTDDGLQIHDWPKLVRHGGRPLALGWCGDFQTARWAIDVILQSEAPQTWQPWLERASEALAEVNGRLVRRAVIAQQRSAETAWLLAAGFVDGSLNAAELNNKGEITLMHDDFLAIGVGRKNARIVFETLKKEGRIVDERFLRDTVSLAVKLTAGCGFPVHVVKITNTGIEDCQPVLGRQ